MVDIDEVQRTMVGPVSRLVEFLRELARAGQPTVRDVAGHEFARWLVELPAGVDVDQQAGPGQVVFSLEPVVGEPPPAPPAPLAPYVEPAAYTDSSAERPDASAVPPEARTDEARRAYEDWHRAWLPWAEADRRVAERRTWFELLARSARLLEQQDDVFELVIGTGLLSWSVDGATIRHPLVTTPAELAVDAATGRIDVRVARDAHSRFGDRLLLDGVPGVDVHRAQPVRDELRQAEAHPLADEAKDLFTRWRGLALDRARPYEHMWEPTTGATPDADLRFAPVLLLRLRDRSSLIDYFDRMLAALSGPDARAPLGLAQLLVALEPEDRLAWLASEGAAGGDVVGGDPLFPLPANPEQRQVIERLVADNGVVVQGPPGTGKTHTIANLLSALLARGQRVLVTSQKAQALRVLRDKLPPEVQQLCVSLTDVARGGSHELNESVTALSDRYANFSPTGHAEAVRRLEATRAHAHQRVAELTERVRELRASEVTVHPPLAPGYAGTRGQVAEALRAGAARCGWMPVPVPDGADAAAPLSVAEAVELRRLLADGTPERRARSDQQLPDLATLPTPVAVEQLVAAERSAAASAEAATTELSALLAGVGPDEMSALRTAVAEVAAALHQVGLGGPPEAWPAGWPARAVADGFAGREMGLWDGLGEVAPRAVAAQEALRAIGLREVTLPPFEASGPESLAGQAEAGRALRDHLAGGHELKRLFAPAVQKRAERLLDGAQVDGVPVTTAAHLDVVLARMDAERTANALAERWAEAGVTVDRSLPLVRAVGQFADLAVALGHVLTAVRRRGEVEARLAGRGALVPLRTPAEWRAFVDSLAAVDARLAAEAATRALAEQVSRLDLAAADPAAPPELARLAAAVSARDVAAYDAALRALAAAPGEQRDQRREDELAARLGAAHPVLADRLAETAGDPAWDERLATLPDAWAWGVARTAFDAQRHPGLEDELAAQLDEAIARAGQATAGLAAQEAWGRCLARMTAHQEQALRLYRESIAQRGKGTGKWAPRYAAAAREAMVEARGAVPAWIMPLREVVDTIPPDANSFDVVIVDEASQASVEALFLLWLAPRVIVVGDERQCAPSLIGRGELQPVFDRLDDYLGDVPEYRRLGFTPKSDLFSLLSTRFGTAIRLREHFRCMPEIIGWSSSMFYRDAPLVPLRQFGSDRLVPLRSVHVVGAATEGVSSRLRNVAEAEAIVAQVVACLDDPAYDGKTFGVVVLQGRGQVRLIDDLLAEAIPQAEREARRLRVGGPAEFQGDERHVVFASMVVADRRSALTHREWQRRFNVAASRAQDQLWLFHSVALPDLSPADLRRSLLGYVQGPPPAAATGVEAAADGLDWSSPRTDPFSSQFQQRVYLALRARGFHATPDVEVNGRRIDLVVTGARARLAVECDGGAWLTDPADQRADIARQLDLRRAGWQFWRVRESEFNLDPEAALASLWPALERRGIQPGDPALAPPTLATTVVVAPPPPPPPPPPPAEAEVAAEPAPVAAPVAPAPVSDRLFPSEPVSPAPAASAGGEGWAPIELSEEESVEGLDDDPAALELDVWASLTPRPPARRTARAVTGTRTRPAPELVLGELPGTSPT